MKRPYIVTSPRQLQAIASRGRDEILDAAGVIGPCTVGELARFLGRSRHALYYHVRALAQCGLLREARSTGGRTKATMKYETPGRPLVVRFDFSTLRARHAVLELAEARLRNAARGFERACQGQRKVVVEGPRRNLWATRWTGTLTSQALEEANRLLARLVELFGTRHSSRPNEQLFELTFVLATTVPRHARSTARRVLSKASPPKSRAPR